MDTIWAGVGILDPVQTLRIVRLGLATAGLLTGLVAAGATAELVELRIDTREPFAAGVAFGAAV